MASDRETEVFSNNVACLKRCPLVSHFSIYSNSMDLIIQSNPQQNLNLGYIPIFSHHIHFCDIKLLKKTYL